MSIQQTFEYMFPVPSVGYHSEHDRGCPVATVMGWRGDKWTPTGEDVITYVGDALKESSRYQAGKKGGDPPPLES